MLREVLGSLWCGLESSAGSRRGQPFEKWLLLRLRAHALDAWIAALGTNGELELLGVFRSLSHALKGL